MVLGMLILITTSVFSADRCARYYRSALRKEFDFFGAHSAKSMESEGRNVLLMVDFDDTCTEKDTISTIVETAIQDSGARENGIAGEKILKEKKELYQRLIDNYISKRSELIKSEVPEVCALSSIFSIIVLLHFVTFFSSF